MCLGFAPLKFLTESQLREILPWIPAEHWKNNGKVLRNTHHEQSWKTFTSISKHWNTSHHTDFRDSVCQHSWHPSVWREEARGNTVSRIHLLWTHLFTRSWRILCIHWCDSCLSSRIQEAESEDLLEYKAKVGCTGFQASLGYRVRSSQHNKEGKKGMKERRKGDREKRENEKRVGGEGRRGVGRDKKDQARQEEPSRSILTC